MTLCEVALFPAFYNPLWRREVAQTVTDPHHCLFHVIFDDMNAFVRAEAYESERHEPNDFMPLPNHYLEIAHVLLIDAKGCFSSAKEYMEVRVCC